MSISIYTYVNYKSNNIVYKTFKIESDITFNKLSKKFYENGIIKSQKLFKYISTFLKFDKNIRSGEFQIPTNMTTYELVQYLNDIEPIKRKVTIIEGLRFEKVVSVLSNSLELDSVKLMNLYNDKKLLTKYNIKADNIEGYIHPQTYFLYWGINEYDVLDFLISKTFEVINEFRPKIDSLNYNIHEIITLASIIEAESNFPDEMPMVSSVYHNRLKKGWKLQADPTILYILGAPQRVLFRHLEIKNPYNTYLYPGLPYGPINSPGRDAIKAAIFPANTNYMYFTGTGDGTGRHLFGKTLKEHNLNRKQLDLARKKNR